MPGEENPKIEPNDAANFSCRGDIRRACAAADRRATYRSRMKHGCATQPREKCDEAKLVRVWSALWRPRARRKSRVVASRAAGFEFRDERARQGGLAVLHPGQHQSRPERQ